MAIIKKIIKKPKFIYSIIQFFKPYKFYFGGEGTLSVGETEVCKINNWIIKIASEPPISPFKNIINKIKLFFYRCAYPNSMASLCDQCGKIVCVYDYYKMRMAEFFCSIECADLAYPETKKSIDIYNKYIKNRMEELYPPDVVEALYKINRMQMECRLRTITVRYGTTVIQKLL